MSSDAEARGTRANRRRQRRHEQCLYVRYRCSRWLSGWCISFFRDDLAYTALARACRPLCPGNDSPGASLWRVHRRSFEIIYRCPNPSARRTIKVRPPLRVGREFAALRLIFETYNRPNIDFRNLENRQEGET